MADALRCPRCSGSLVRLESSHEPEGIRKDARCTECHHLFAVTKGALVLLPLDTVARVMAEHEDIRLGPNSPLRQNLANVQRGIIARAHGKDAENEVDLALQELRLRKEGVFASVRPDVHGRPGEMKWGKASEVDRVGTISGRPVAFDIKHVTGERFGPPTPSRNKGKALETFQRQVDFLIDFSRWGEAYFLVRQAVKQAIGPVHVWWRVYPSHRKVRGMYAGPLDTSLALHPDTPGVRGPFPTAMAALVERRPADR